MLKKKNYKKLASTLWSDVIREVGICEMCNLKGIPGEKQGWINLNAHHLISRTYSEYRTDLSNGVSLCVNCHKWSPISPHQNSEGFERWLKEKRPGQWLWYDRHYPLEMEKEINGEIIMCRTVKKTPGFRVSWREEYEKLKAMRGEK